MSLLPRWRARRNKDLDDEIADHFRRAIADRVARGESPEAALAAVHREFGNVGRVGEITRESWGWARAAEIGRDLRSSGRQLWRSPRFTLVAVLSLGLGIGATTAIYSVVDAVLLRVLPYPDPDRIVRVAATLRPTAHLPGFSGAGGRSHEAFFSDRGYWHFVRNNRSFTAFGGYRPQTRRATLTGQGTTLQVVMAQMTRSAFEVLGVRPERGRLPTAEEDLPNGPNVVLLSHDFWVNRYGADPSILGRTIELSGVPIQVIGVMSSGYDFPTPEAEVWIPLRLNPASEYYESHNISAIARLAPGKAPESAVRDAENLIARFDEAGYGANWLTRVFDGGVRVTTLKEDIVGDARRPLLILFGMVGLVLLIACSNVANLLLVRAESRTRESAVRLALGSGRGRLMQNAFIESNLLVLAGALVGVLLAYAATRALVTFGSAGIPRLKEIGIRGSVLAFTGGVAILAGLLFGTLPALRAGSQRSLAALRDGGRGSTVGKDRHRARSALGVMQVALAVVVLVGSGLMIRTFRELRAVDPGFDPDHVLTFSVQPPYTKYPDPEAMPRLYDQLRERLLSLPGVTDTGGITTLPLTGAPGMVYRAIIDDAPSPEREFPPTFLVRRVTPGYFEAMGAPILEGRFFAPEDHNLRLGSLIITSSVKRQYWPNGSALGKRVNIEGVIPARIVGVVGDVHDVSLEIPAEQFMYLPMLDSAGGGVGGMTIAMRTKGDPQSLGPAVRAAIAEMDPELPLSDMRSMKAIVADSLSRTTITMTLLILGAVVALLLGCVGIYGVISYIVTQRTAEIGVRLALGADPSKIGLLVLSQGMRLAATGVAIGLAGSAALGKVVRSLLYGVSPFDPLAFVGASVLFLVVAALAILVPALRATRTHPVAALRAQ